MKINPHVPPVRPDPGAQAPTARRTRETAPGAEEEATGSPAAGQPAPVAPEDAARVAESLRAQVAANNREAAAAHQVSDVRRLLDLLA